MLESYYTLRYYYSPEKIRGTHVTDFNIFFGLLTRTRQILLNCGYQINELEPEAVKSEFQRTLRNYELD